MSYSTEDWRKAVTKLLKLTSQNELHWESTDIYESDGWSIVEQSFMAKHKDKAYVISILKKRHYLDEYEYILVPDYKLSIYLVKPFDEYERIATAPELSSLSSLFEAAENNMAFNVKALGDLLE